MKWKGPIKNINVRLPQDLHAKIKSEAPLRGKTIEQAYEEGMGRWLSPGVAGEEAPGGDSIREPLEMLKFILENGTADQAAWITGNLKTFSEAIELRKTASRRKAG